jgi:hypothetical protein
MSNVTPKSTTIAPSTVYLPGVHKPSHPMRHGRRTKVAK